MLKPEVTDYICYPTSAGSKFRLIPIVPKNYKKKQKRVTDNLGNVGVKAKKQHS